jgi:cytochrome c oxidase subunit 2
MNIFKWFGVCIFAVIIFTGCGSSEETTSNTNEQSAANVVTIKASNFKFDAEEYVVKKGEPVTIKLENAQGIHGIGIKDLNVDLNPNKNSVTITPDQPGRYEILCTIMCGTGHAEMKSLLVVE